MSMMMMMVMMTVARGLLTEQFWRHALKRLWELPTQTNVPWDASLVVTYRSCWDLRGLTPAVTLPAPTTSHDPPPVSHDYTAITWLADGTQCMSVTDRQTETHSQTDGVTDIERLTDRYIERKRHNNRSNDRQTNRDTQPDRWSDR